jgi:hypothetical protein
VLSGIFITPHAAQSRVMKQLQSKTLDWGYLKLLKVGSEKLMPMLCLKVGEGLWNALAPLLSARASAIS